MISNVKTTPQQYVATPFLTGAYMNSVVQFFSFVIYRLEFIFRS